MANPSGSSPGAVFAGGRKRRHGRPLPKRECPRCGRRVSIMSNVTRNQLRAHDCVRISWTLPGGPSTPGLPEPANVKAVGGRVEFTGPRGTFGLWHTDRWGDERYPWHVARRGAVGVDNPADAWDEPETFPQYREAVRFAVALALGRDPDGRQVPAAPAPEAK